MIRSMLKQCSKCKQNKPLLEYHKSKGKSFGVNSYCKVCSIEVSKQWYKDNGYSPEVKSRLRLHNLRMVPFFRGIIDDLKRQIGCSCCDEKEPCCIDFHHISQDKEFEISYLVRAKSETKLRSELIKCTCLCSNCHRKVHAGIIKKDDLHPLEAGVVESLVFKQET